MKIQVDVRTAIALQVLLENQEVKKLHQELVKSYMDTADVSEEEARQTIGSDWIQGCVKAAQEMIQEIDVDKKEQRKENVK